MKTKTPEGIQLMAHAGLVEVRTSPSGECLTVEGARELLCALEAVIRSAVAMKRDEDVTERMRLFGETRTQALASTRNVSSEKKGGAK